MLKICKSDSLIILAEELANQLTEKAPEDPFDLIQILVPNQDTARWLKLQLSEINEIVANVEFLLPAEWQFQQIRKFYKNLPSLLPSDPIPLTWSVFEILLNDDKRKKISRADRYVKTQPPEMKEQAAMQLAEKISSVFDQYMVYRPELINKWQSGVPVSDVDERWQAELWNLTEAERKKREKGTGYPNRAELELEALKAIKTGDIVNKKPLFLFNTSLIPKPVLQMVGNLSEQTDVIIFQISVSSRTESSSADSNALLEAFGDEAKGRAILYSTLEGKVETYYSDLPGSSEALLQKVQQAILSNTSLRSWSAEEGDETAIEIHSCHTPLREVEVLHQFLLRKFEVDPDLYPDDVLVMMPDPEIYKPFIHAVFGTKTEGVPEIPYHMGSRSSEDVDLIRLLIQLLDLADSRMEFDDVMDLFMEQKVRKRFNVSESGAERIKGWMKENNVIWGMDSEHRVKSEQPGENLHTWQLAMQRGWRGMLLGSQDDPFKEDSLNFLRVRGSDQEMEWSAFSSFLRLLNNLNSSINKRRPADAWCDKIEQMTTTFFSEEALASKEADALWRALEKTKESISISGSKSKITFKLIRRSLRNILSINPASTANFTRGVTFNSMVPVRSIPAKIVALIGLNESDFPRKPKHPDFDLMARNPEPIERNRKNEDRNLFLESIMAAENYHYCSYIGRSRRDNEPIPPSPIVSEWLTQIGGMLGKEPKELIIQEPLHGFSVENFRQKRSYARAEFSVAELLVQNSSNQPGLFLKESITDHVEDKEIKLEDLLRFYSNPVRFFFKSRFQPEINSSEEQRNEFVLNNLEKHNLFDQVFRWRLAGKCEQEILSLLYKTGSVPAGWQGESLLREVFINIETAIFFLKERNIKPELNIHSIDIRLESGELTGSLNSYSKNIFLDISSSSYSGSKVLKSWICHLALTSEGRLAGRNSHFLCDLKKGDPSFITFQPVNDAPTLISRLMEIYQLGICRPQLVFPDTSFEFEKAVLNASGQEEYKAELKFEGGSYQQYAENKDFFLSLLRGVEPPFSMEFITQDFQAVLRVMLNHMDPIK